MSQGKKYSVVLSNRKDMNQLVALICEKLDKNEEAMRDKFKIVGQADTKGVLELCKFLKLKFIMDPTGKHNMISVEIPFSMMVETVEDPEPKQESSPEETEEDQNDLPPGEEPSEEEEPPF